MTLHEARKILALAPDEDPRPYLADFKSARERIAALVSREADEALADRYYEGLVEFDQAIAVIRDSLEAPGPVAPPARPTLIPPATAAAILSGIGAPDDDRAPAPRRRALVWLVWLLVILAGAAFGGWLYHQYAANRALQQQARIAYLEREGSVLVENRRWQEATRAFAEIEALVPGSEVARIGRSNIEVGMAEEQTQFVGYWTGQAISELDSGRLDEAQAAIQQVLEKHPADKDAVAIRERIAVARAGQTLEAAIAAARKQLDNRQWASAITAARRILATTPHNEDAQAILTDATAALAKHTADQILAKELLEKAVARDQGQFDAQALDWLREASALAPNNPEIAARLEKMASYTRTLRVPGDFATPAEALAVARANDRIVLSEKTWQGPLIVNAAIDLQGAGSAKTVVECPATEGSPITIGPDGKGARISGITFRHESFHAIGTTRFSAALVRGGTATFVDCRFSDASGHGLVVIEQGGAIASRCRFSDNGWNGAAAIGNGCVLEVRDSESLNNFEHGIESWDGAAVTLVNNRCEGNTRNGIHVDNGAASAIIEGNQLIANREFGLVLASAGAGKISGNTARANLLGGLVIRAAAAALTATGNQATLNQGPGLVLEKGLPPASYASNTVTQNTPQQIIADANLSQQEEPKPVVPNNQPR
jgi:parallel beta-helix repeat protein